MQPIRCPLCKFPNVSVYGGYKGIDFASYSWHMRAKCNKCGRTFSMNDEKRDLFDWMREEARLSSEYNDIAWERLRELCQIL